MAVAKPDNTVNKVRMIKTQVQHSRFSKLFLQLHNAGCSKNSKRDRMPENENNNILHLRQECNSL